MVGRAFVPLVLLAMLALAGCGTAPRASGPASSPGPVRTLTYCNGQLMDIQEGSGRGPHPVAVYVHGGGWERGDRRGGGFIGVLRPELASRGFVVASIDYRLAPANRWPAQIVDAKCAIRYLRAHHADYDLDSSRIGVWGGSAGGQLVSLLGLAGPQAGWDVGAYSDQSSQVQAVVDLFGPSDFTGELQNSAIARSRIHQLLGNVPPSSRPAALAAASPVTYIKPGDPPFLILQGEADTTVPPAQSVELDQRLRAAGDSSRLVLVAGGRHGLLQPDERPGQAQLEQTIVDFLVQHLG